MDLVNFEVIGRGASSIVYKALNKRTGEIVAVKSIESDDETTAYVSFEIDLLKKLQHPNVIQMFGYIKQEKNMLLLVMEYCEAGSLLDLITKFGSVDENEVTVFVQQVLHGLHYLHEQGVIHRDIKYESISSLESIANCFRAANVLITNTQMCKLADFGISSQAEQHTGGLFEGSPYWIAPEVVQLNGATKSSDIWSLGCLAIELYTGYPPYYHLDPMSALFKIASDDYYPFPPDISNQFLSFLTNCFQKDPNLRISAKRLLNHSFITGLRRREPERKNLTVSSKKQICISKYREDFSVDDYSSDYLIPSEKEIFLQETSIQEQVILDDLHQISDGLIPDNFPKLSHCLASIDSVEFKNSINSLNDQIEGYLDFKLVSMLKLHRNLPIQEISSVELLCSIISQVPAFSFEIFGETIEYLLSSESPPDLQLIMINRLRNILDDKLGNPEIQLALAVTMSDSNIPLQLLRLLQNVEDNNHLIILAASDLLLSLSIGSSEVKAALIKSENHLRELLRTIDIHNHEISLKMLKLLKNVVSSIMIQELDLYMMIKNICKQLWRIDGKNDLEISSTCLFILMPVLHLNKERLECAIENGLMDSLLHLSLKDIKPTKQFILQLFCEILGYCDVPSKYVDPVVTELVNYIGDICWRGSIFEAIARWMTKESKLLELAILKVDFKNLFSKTQFSFQNMQDNFLFQLYRISSQNHTVATYLVANQVLLLLCQVSSQNPTILIDLLRLFKFFLLIEARIPQSQLNKVLEKVKSLTNHTSILVDEAAKSLCTLIRSHSTKIK